MNLSGVPENDSHLNNGTELIIAKATDPSWTFMPVFQLICNIIGIVDNGLVLAMFLLKPPLITSFNVYLAALLATNTLFAMSGGPLDVINNLYPTWIAGRRWCTFYLYLTHNLQGLAGCIHLGITLNRAWAVFFPLHYRSQQSVKLSLAIVGSFMVYTHALTLPYLLVDLIYHRQPEEEHGCVPNIRAQFVYSSILQFCFWDAVLFFNIVLYPTICCRYFGVRRARARLRPVHVSSGQNLESRAQPATSTTRSRQLAERVMARTEFSHGFRILTMLMISVSICWIPLYSYFTIGLFMDLQVDQFYRISMVLYYLQAILDPVYIIIGMPALRDELRRLFMRGCILDNARREE